MGKIKKIMSERGISVYKMAKDLNRPTSSIYRMIENGNMYLDNAVEIANYLDVSLDELIGRGEKEED